MTRTWAKPRSCLHCCQDITGAVRSQRYCSSDCRQAQSRSRKSLKAVNSRKTRLCRRCQTPIPTMRGSGALYCSSTCAKLIARERNRSGYGKCLIPDCDGTISTLTGKYAKMCAAHQQRARSGKPLYTPIIRKMPVVGDCGFPGCFRKVSARGLCVTHYTQLRNGEILHPIILRRSKVSLGSRKLNQGYVRVKTASGWEREHTIIIERLIGRKLKSYEQVHHINGVRDDNRPENLELWSVSQPSGQRAIDKLAWARQIIEDYSGIESQLTMLSS